MRNILAFLGRVASVVYDRLGDPRTKNVLLAILAAMTLFGIVLPDEATSIRDTLIAMAL